MVFLCMSNLNNNKINNNNTENPEVALNLFLWMPLACVLVEQSSKTLIVFFNLLSSQEAGLQPHQYDLVSLSQVTGSLCVRIPIPAFLSLGFWCCSCVDILI